MPEQNTITVIVKVSGEDLVRLKRFAEREGFSSPHLALRAMALAALDTYPKLGIFKAEREAHVREFTQRAFRHVKTLVESLQQDSELYLQADRNAEATSEKESVTFTRENQE